MSYLLCVTNAAFAAKRNSVLANLSVNSTSLDVDMGDNKKCDICELGATNADAEVAFRDFFEVSSSEIDSEKRIPQTRLLPNTLVAEIFRNFWEPTRLPHSVKIGGGQTPLKRIFFGVARARSHGCCC